MLTGLQRYRHAALLGHLLAFLLGNLMAGLLRNLLASFLGNLLALLLGNLVAGFLRNLVTMLPRDISTVFWVLADKTPWGQCGISFHNRNQSILPHMWLNISSRK